MDELTFKEALQQVVAEWYNPINQRRNPDLYKVAKTIKYYLDAESIEDMAETASQIYAENVDYEYKAKHPNEELVKKSLTCYMSELSNAYKTGYADGALNDLINKKKNDK